MKTPRTKIWREGQTSGVCTLCGIDRGIDYFRVVTGYRSHICKVCRPDGVALKSNGKPWTEYYTKNADAILKRQRKRHVGRKVQVLEKMGGKCACCGETEMAF